MILFCNWGNEDIKNSLHSAEIDQLSPPSVSDYLTLSLPAVVEQADRMRPQLSKDKSWVLVIRLMTPTPLWKRIFRTKLPRSSAFRLRQCVTGPFLPAAEELRPSRDSIQLR